MKWLDDFFERSSAAPRSACRAAARGRIAPTGRRRLRLPVLPFDRIARAAAGAGGKKKEPDVYQCDYWRYCAVDGFLCSCCGGTMSTCPPGTEVSKVAWIGTCRNPQDGKDYLISYNDCCGKTACGRCLCNTNLGERPGYRMGLHNDVNWCMANTSSTMFHCTTAVLIGLAEKDS